MKDTKNSDSFFKRLFKSKKNIAYIVYCLISYVITVEIVLHYDQFDISMYWCIAPLLLFIYCMRILSNIIMDISRQITQEKQYCRRGKRS